MKSRLINHLEYQKLKFWTSYTQSELAKAEEGKTGINGLNSGFINIFLSRLYRVNQLWKASWKEYDREFWGYYLKETKILSMNIIFVNSLTLSIFFVAPFLTGRATVSTSTDSQSNFFAGMAYVSSWMILNLICFIYFLLLHYAETSFVKSLGFDLYQVWCSISNILFCFRLFSLTRSISYLIFTSNTCFESYLLRAHETSSGYFIFVYCMDIYQSFVFSTLPLSSKIILGISIIATFENCLRILTCFGEMDDISDMKLIMHFAMISIGLSLIIFNAIFTITFERSVYSSFINIKNELQAAKENNKVVNRLCRDIKIPVQTLQRVVLSMRDKVKFKDQKFDSQLQASSDAVNSLIDGTIYLLKASEKRYQFSYKDEINLNEEINKVLKIFKVSMNFSKDLNCLFPLNSDPLKVISDRNCVNTLFYYSIFTISMVLGEGAFKTFLEAHESPVSSNQNTLSSPQTNLPTIKISYQMVSVNSSNDNISPSFQLKVSIYWDSAFQSLPSFAPISQFKNPKEKVNYILNHLSEENRESMVAASVICNKIMEACGGNWELHYDHIDFSCPILSMKKELPKSLIPSPAIDITSERFLEGFYQFLQNRVSFYITDIELESLVQDFLKDIDISIRGYKTLNSAELKVEAIIFVQSLEACNQIRRKGFEGDIVICSEQLLYLENTNELEKLYSYGISLPCPKSEQDLFLTWIRERYFEMKTSNNFVDKNSVKFRKTYSDFPILEERSKKDSTYFTSAILLIKNYLFFYSSPSTDYPLTDYDNYIKWRSLNPGNITFHHTSSFILFVVVFFLFDLFYYRMNLYSFPLLACKLFSYFLYSSSHILYFQPFIDKYFGYNKYVRYVGIIITIFSFILLVTEFARIYIHPHYDDNGHRVFVYKATPFNTCNLKDFSNFLTHLFGSFRGIFSIFTFLNFTINMKGMAILLSWPYSFPNFFFLLLRVFITCKLIIHPCFGNYIFNILAALCIFFAFKLLNANHHLERFYRKEYQMLRQNILSRDLLQRLNFLSNKSLLHPMKILSQLQTKFIRSLIKSGTHNSLLIDENILDDVELLNRNIIITRELIMKMNADYYLLHGRIPDGLFEEFLSGSFSRRENLLGQMKAYFVKDLVEKIASHFEYQTDDLKLKVFCHCDPYLHFIRLDANIFSTLLSDVCRSAVQRIQNARDVNIKDKQHEILIWLQPYDFSTNTCQLPNFKQNHQFAFNDVRLMDVLVLDTGILPGYKRPLDTLKNSDLFEISGKENEPWTNVIRKSNNKLKSEFRIHEDEIHSQSSLGDQYAEFFGFLMKYHQGSINHYHYNSFQRLGIPYLLCRDSSLISSLDEDRQSNLIRSLNPVHISYYRLFCKLLKRYPYYQPDSPECFVSLYFYFSNYGPTDKSNSFCKMFQKLNHQSFIHPIKDTVKPSTFMTKDWVILEYDPINRKKVYNLRDLVHYIRGHGFQGMIVVLQHLPTSIQNYSTKDLSRNQNTASLIETTLQATKTRNHYVDGVTVDLVIPYPLTEELISKIQHHYRSKVISSMIDSTPNIS